MAKERQQSTGVSQDNFKPAITNDYILQPRNLIQYNAFRGVTDFSQIGQFALYETGYSYLVVLEMPKFMKELARYNIDNRRIFNGFKHMLEYEFRGLDGLSDITTGTSQISDGINEVQLINKVTRDTSINVSMSFYEKTGSPIMKFSEMYLTGIKDPNTQAKTYHGLIQNGVMAPGPENEIFTMMYIVTDNTMCRIERAVLLCNMQLTKAEESMYNTTRGDINTKETTVDFNCYPIYSEYVDKAAKQLLTEITGYKHYTNTTNTLPGTINVAPKGTMAWETDYAGGRARAGQFATLDSGNFKYGILDESNANTSAQNQKLIDLLNQSNQV